MTDKVVTVRLEIELFDKLTKLSASEKSSKGAIMKRALERYIQLKTSPETSEVNTAKRIASLESQVYNLVNRINILSRQLENVQSGLKGKV